MSFDSPRDARRLRARRVDGKLPSSRARAASGRCRRIGAETAPRRLILPWRPRRMEAPQAFTERVEGLVVDGEGAAAAGEIDRPLEPEQRSQVALQRQRVGILGGRRLGAAPPALPRLGEALGLADIEAAPHDLL